MRVRKSIAYLALIIVPLTSALAKESDEATSLKEKLFARYDQQNVVLLANSILLGPHCPTCGFKDYFSMRADHFGPSIEVPKAYKKVSAADDRTFMYANKRLGGYTMSIAGRHFLVRKLYVTDKEVILALLSRSPGDTNGVDFHFIFAPDMLKSGDYDSLVKEIDRYVLPEADAIKKAESEKKVEVQPGMTKEDALKALGEPVKEIVFGNKTILKYQDITVELEDNKVVSVKAN